MPVELKVPSVGESITEVEIGEWRKGEGDGVRRDETVVLIETEKTSVELPSPIAGKLTRILKKEGETAAVGEVIAHLAEAEAEAEEPEKPEKPERPEKAEEAPRRREKARPAPREAAPTVTKERPAPAEERARPRRRKGGAEPAVVPAAKRLLEEYGIEPGEVEATGREGRLLKEDVLRHVGKLAEEAEKEAEAPVESAEAAPEPEAVPEADAEAEAEAEAEPRVEARREETVAMSPLRRTVAERLVRAQQQAALLTTFNEIDMSAVLELRRQYQELFQKRYEIKLGLMSFFVKASVEALKLIPQVNAEIRGKSIVFKNHYDIGIAVGGGKGLVVPVVRDADRLSFAEIELSIAELAGRARDGTLAMEDLEGGTFTITNGGIYGSLLSTPIVNPPQSGILGLHKIEERPVARDGQVVIRPMMYVALTYDHRIVDGREAVTFLKRIKETVEDPRRMLVEV